MCVDCGCAIVEGYAVEGERVQTHPVEAHASNGHGHGHSHGLTHTHDGHTHTHDDSPHTHAHSHDGHTHTHDSHDHSHTHDHDGLTHTHAPTTTVSLKEAVLSKNDRLAERNRGFFQAKGWLVLNLFSSPGSGKTALLERTFTDMKDTLKAGVVVGDLETANDAERIRRSGAPAVQITTGNVCHLEADMVARAVERLKAEDLQLLFIENVGNLVCPAAYDLGEDLRVALLSVSEGEDKPLKYPTLFKSADLILVTKMDIADAVEFDREAALQNIRRVAPQAEVLEVSSKTGEGMQAWYGFLSGRLHTATVEPAGLR